MLGNIPHKSVIHITGLCTGEEAGEAASPTVTAGRRRGQGSEPKAQIAKMAETLMVPHPPPGGPLCCRDKTRLDLGGTTALGVHVMDEGGVHSSPKQTLLGKEF